MLTLSRFYDRLVTSLAIIAGLAIWGIVFAILADVIARQFGLPGTKHTYALIEYGLLVITILGSPWLIRSKGHIYVEIIFQALPARFQIALATSIYLICMSVCLLLCAYSLGEVISAFQRGVMETRSFDIPRWIPMSVFPLGFSIMAIEFARCLFGWNSLYFDSSSHSKMDE